MCAKLFHSVKVTRARRPSTSEDATWAHLRAPAVWEEEGPTIMGPRTSKAEVVAKVWGFPAIAYPSIFWSAEPGPASATFVRYAAAMMSTQPWRPKRARLTTRSLLSCRPHLPLE